VRRIDVQTPLLAGAQMIAVPSHIPGAQDVAFYQPADGSLYLVETTPAGSPCARRVARERIGMRWTSIVALRRDSFALLDGNVGYLCFLTFVWTEPCQPL